MLRAGCCCCWKASKNDEETERVEAPTGRPLQGSSNIGKPVSRTIPARLGRAYAKLVKRGPSTPERQYARVPSSQTSAAKAETANQSSAAEVTSAASDSSSIEGREASAPLQALAAVQAELAATDAQLVQAGFSRQNLPQDLAAVHSRQQEAAQRCEELQRLLDDARQQVIQTQRNNGAAQEQLSAQQASKQSLLDSVREAEAIEIELQRQLISNADLQAVVRGLEQALAQQQVVTEEAQARALHAQQQVQEAHTLTDHLRKASQANDTALTSLKAGLQRAVEEKAAMTEEAKAERHTLEACILRLRAELLQQEQANLQAASAHFEPQLTVLQEQLEEQERMVAFKEEQLQKITAAQDEQLQQAASSKADLSQRFANERNEMQAALDELQLKAAALEAADRAHINTLQAGLQRADQEKAATTEEAKAERHTLEAHICRLRAELLQQEQANLQAASAHFEPQLSVLQEQLEEQERMIAFKEEQLQKITAAKNQQLQEQLQEAASSKADLSQGFASQMHGMQAVIDEQKLRVAQLEAANVGLDSAHNSTLQAMAKLKQKFKDKAASSMDSFNRALQTKQQEMDTGLSEKNMALAAANQALEDAQAASTLALQDLDTDMALMQVSLDAQKQKVADLESAARECSSTHRRTLQVQTQAAQKEVAAAQRAKSETASVQCKLKTSSERNAAQQGKLVQLQAEVEQLRQQLQQQLQEIQASGAGELRPLSDRQPGPLCFTSHEMHAHVAHPRTQPQTSVLSMPQPPPARPHPLVFSQPSTSQAVSRTDSLGSVASSASLGPRTPFSRQNASTPFSQGRPVLHYQPHLQPSQVQVVSQTAEGRGRGITPGTNGAELALPSMWREHVVQPAPGFAGAHVKALVGEVVRVDSSTGDDTHKVFSKICHRNGWRLYVDVRGDGNCGYRAVAVGLVVAIAGLSAESRHSFMQHLEQLDSAMQQRQGLLQFSSASGGNAHQGFEALRTAFENEPTAADRLRMDGRTAVPSTALLRFLNVAERSDAVVLFMRALSAFHLLTHSQEFQMSLMAQFDEHEEERQWPLNRICHEYILPFCEGMQSAKADKREADASNTIRAIAEALQLVIRVGTDTHVQPYGAGTAQRSTAAWSHCQLGVVFKPGHFGIAWA